MLEPHRLHHCPVCQKELTIATLECKPCDLRLEGHFSREPTTGNEFSKLPEEDLHLLRIFVHCEGSIREMESALGVSYPTIKSRLAKLRETLKPIPSGTKGTPKDKSARRFKAISDVLSALEEKEIDHTESLRLIKEIKSGKEPR
ncbi:MAG: DUF2089 family protein [Deltaproteobacteria bacterium]|jgi:hypothetical protein|nr:DUF2089 family protein [Deltaproteobacteria bacterium]